MYRAAPRRLAWFAVAVALLAGCDRRQHLVEQHLLEFGTIIQITLAVTDLTRAERLLADIEGRLKLYRGQWHAWEDSDLTQFNAALQRGEKVEIPASLAPLLRLCREYYDLTGGLFNPALGKLVAAYGFHGSPPAAAQAESLRIDLPTMRDLRVEDGFASSRNPRLQLDLGGIAKGYALALIGEYLEANGVTDYVLNAGGDLLVGGDRFGRPWRIGIQNPFAPGVIGSIELSGRHSLFTSGNYLRRYRRGEEIRHHIIDPRSGDSSRGQSAATVLTADPVRADVAATALMIDGLEGHRALADALELDDYLVIGETREILISRSLYEKIRIKVPWPTKIVN